jgi:hypothetical protein
MNICVCAVVSRIDSFMKYTLKLEKLFDICSDLSLDSTLIVPCL